MNFVLGTGVGTPAIIVAAADVHGDASTQSQRQEAHTAGAGLPLQWSINIFVPSDYLQVLMEAYFATWLPRGRCSEASWLWAARWRPWYVFVQAVLGYKEGDLAPPSPTAR